MAKNLLIVESPAKATTINKYLGKDFEVLASYGHVRDLIPKEGAVDPEDEFRMRYDLIERNKKHVDRIVKAARKADAIYLATDLDREGEAISWHIAEILREKGLNREKPIHRVVFSEITERAIQQAMENPRALAEELVDAQQARRALDYLVGFNLSPLLWKKVRRGLSAGRVQSPALRMIVEREEEIERFEPREYWTIEADAEGEGNTFLANLVRLGGKKLRQFDIGDGETAHGVRDRLTEAAGGKLPVSRIEKKQRKRNPSPPFITSTLQQEAARRLRFTTQRTMRVAQQLYEGVEIQGGNQGLITYMRTDSVALASDAISEFRKTIVDEFGKETLPDKPRFYKSKSKNAQEAHEAIRPTSAALTPLKLKRFLSEDQYRLYELIWRRALACQMLHATLDTVAVEFDVTAEDTFRATGSTLRDPGFLKAYGDIQSDPDKVLPPLTEGDRVPVAAIRAEQHFTDPPPRYSEASLVKALEDHGIGRPSTYASIIQTLKDREYVDLENRRFTPTDTGRVVAKFLINHFERYVDYDFTARLEDELDAISRGEQKAVPLLKEFWQPFKDTVEHKEETVSREEAQQARELGTDPASGRRIVVRLGRYGPFAQIGHAEDEEKPRFAGLRPGQKMDTITLEEALDLFKLPRDLGETPEGEPMSANIGRFGPYIRYGNQFASLKEHDPLEVTRDQALEVVAADRKAKAERLIQEFPAEGIRVLKGRYGPYVTDGRKNASVPKDTEPADLDLEACQKLIAEAPERRRGKKKSAKKKAAAGVGKKAGGKKTAKKKTSKKSSKKKASKKKSSKKKASKKKAARKKTAAAAG